MTVKEMIEELKELDRQPVNRSNKPLKRLKQSLRDLRRNQLLDLLPGSAYRGYQRGNL